MATAWNGLVFTAGGHGAASGSMFYGANLDRRPVDGDRLDLHAVSAAAAGAAHQQHHNVGRPVDFWQRRLGPVVVVQHAPLSSPYVLLSRHRDAAEWLRVPSTHRQGSGVARGCQGGAPHRLTDLDAHGRVRSAMPGSTAGGARLRSRDPGSGQRPVADGIVRFAAPADGRFGRTRRGAPSGAARCPSQSAARPARGSAPLIYIRD
jgi:hypothetical protein